MTFVSQDMDSSKYFVALEPHSDDVVIGIGGTVLQLLEEGWHGQTIVMTDGRYGSTELSPADTEQIRKEEKRTEAQELGVGCEFLDYEDSMLDQLYDEKHSKILSDIENKLPNIESMVLFIPSPTEPHPDHRATCEFGLDLKEQTEINVNIIYYMIWETPYSPIKISDIGNILSIDISEYLEKKKELIKIHESQEKEYRYSEMASLLNKYISRLYFPYVSHEASELLCVKNSAPIIRNSLDCKEVADVLHENVGDIIETRK